MHDARSAAVWPVRWQPLVSAGRQPEDLLDDPQLAAHRILDRLGSMGFDARDGVTGAVDAFVGGFAELRRAFAGLPEDSGPTPHAAAARARVVLTLNKDDTTSAAPASDGEDTDDTTLIDRRGADALEALAFRLVGDSAAATVRRLVAAASAVESALLAPGQGREFRADVAVLAGSPGDISGRGEKAPWRVQDAIAVAGLVAKTPTPCERKFEEVKAEELDRNPPPEGSPISTTGIEHVEVNQPCGNSPVMTIHGSAFPRAFGVSLIVATWDAHQGHVAYRQIPTDSWSDTTIVAHLPENVISGTAAFANLDAVTNFNNWVDRYNAAVAARMRASGCPGVWKAWEPFLDVPAPVPAAAYTAGGPQVVAEVAPAFGATELWNPTTLHLQAGQAFRVSWTAHNAGTVVLRPLDDAALAVVVASGRPAADITVDPAGGNLLLTAGGVPARASFAVVATNQCRSVQAPLHLMVTVPPLQDATLEVFQSVAGGDVEVGDDGSAGETLDPPSGSTIPLVADKRSVAVIDWWAAIPQLPPGEQVIATATLEVKGPLVGEIGVTLWPSAQTSDETPPTVPVELPAGPGFASLAAYQQWLARSIIPPNNPQTFNVVLPPQVCLGGPITGLDIPGWTLLDATVRVVCLDGPTWILTPSNRVTFHKRRPVTIRYRAWGWTTNLPPGQAVLTPPSDQACRTAVKVAGSLLPIPDPDIEALANSPVEQNGHLVEDLSAERAAAVPAGSRDEIWLVIGPQGVGGVTIQSTMPWVSATDATGPTIAHEICHQFGQNHLNLCNLTDGDPPSSFPNNGNVVVSGYDMWNNTVVRNALDIMVRTYCPEPTWPSPERWRRVFLQVGPR